MIAPRFEDAAFGLLNEVLDGDALAARIEDNAVAPVGSMAMVVSVLKDTFEAVSVTRDVNVSEAVGVSEPADVSEVIEAAKEAVMAVEVGSVDTDKVDVEETVVVLGDRLGNKPMTPAVVNDSVSSSSSSGQMPEVHGLLEQHPRKLPAVQTYHCAVPEQVLRSRGTRDP
ncbi:hypothetical protein PDIP_06970 [Penicillium digitatum Pd1]|uniref:Uncharacterized protein n=1 Tax=Penicillium digitatum (strain Pd1 / CECT 20795) TaxID=1170230 RepID=K9H3H9_PEND1|nr:hypothetical protein PDIP_06970 [Penicillium digitatum Pd1]EKV21398.1 hypothetical protein PDIP_06970 [Penicillium digitatum Pd1]